MYSKSAQSPGLATHAAQLKADTTGEMFRSLEDGLEEAINLVTPSNGSGRTSEAAMRLETAFEAAEKILEKARSMRPRRT